MSAILSQYDSYICSSERSKTFQRWRDPKEMWFPVKVTFTWERTDIERKELEEFENPHSSSSYEIRVESKEGVFIKHYPYYDEAEDRWYELCYYAKEDKWDEFDKVISLYFEGKIKWMKE